MRRTLDLISIFDNDAFAGQRVRAYDIKNGRPSDISRELDDIFKAYSLSGDKGTSAVHFIPVNRINTILAVAPNPGSFTQVENWIQKLDIPAKVTAGSVDNYVYKLKYAKAEIIGSVINQLYGGVRFVVRVWRRHLRTGVWAIPKRYPAGGAWDRPLAAGVLRGRGIEVYRRRIRFTLWWRRKPASAADHLMAITVTATTVTDERRLPRQWGRFWRWSSAARGRRLPSTRRGHSSREHREATATVGSVDALS